MDESNFNVSFISHEFGGSGSSNFVGFLLDWECTDNIYDECAHHDHECSVYETCIDMKEGYTCQMRHADDPELIAERPKSINIGIQQRGFNIEDQS